MRPLAAAPGSGPPTPSDVRPSADLVFGWQQRAVQITNALAAQVSIVLQGRGERAQDVERLADIAVDGRDAHAKACRELGVDIFTPQVGQDQQGLPAAGQPPPPAPIRRRRAARCRARNRRVEVDRSIADG